MFCVAHLMGVKHPQVRGPWQELFHTANPLPSGLLANICRAQDAGQHN
jgi:hypothetical protein